MLAFGPSFQFYSLDSTDALNKVKNVVVNPLSGLNQASIYKKQAYFGGILSLIVDTRNTKALPDRGVNWITTLRSLSGINDNSFDRVSQLNTDFAFYLKLIPDRLVLANRIGGGATLGKNFEFFQAQYLGSDENLRGYRKERFAGTSKFYNQTELRLKLANFNTYLFPAAFGVFAFFDAGRVWVKDDNDKKMLSGYGGGFWFSPLRLFVISASYAISKEDKIPLVSIGFKF